MPNRFQANTRAWVYRFLVLRDGEQCARCFILPTANKGSTANNTLDIDHVDGNHLNNDPDNLRLLCRSCNVSLANSARSPSDQSERERERKEGRPQTRIVRQSLDFRSPEAPTTLQANFLYEVDFRRWLLSFIHEKGFITKQDAANAGAEVVGCSPLTTSRYISKLTSLTGPLQELRDMLGDTVLVLRAEYKPPPTVKVDLDAVLRERVTPPIAQGTGGTEAGRG